MLVFSDVLLRRIRKNFDVSKIRLQIFVVLIIRDSFTTPRMIFSGRKCLESTLLIGIGYRVHDVRQFFPWKTPTYKFCRIIKST